jgi:hypothetical protein
MYQNIKTVAILYFIFFTCFTIQAQDTIFRKNNKRIEAKIVEINADEIKYRTYDQPNGIIFTIDITLVKKIILENGTVQHFKNESNIDNPELYAEQKRRAYKISFLDPLFGHTVFTYERNLKPGHSMEWRLNVIGLGKTSNNNNNNNFSGSTILKPKLFGLGLTAGYKFYHKPEYYSSRQRYAHLLKGGYIRPEINLTSYGKNIYVYSGTNSGTGFTSTPKRVNTTYGALMLSFGKQWIIDDAFAIDVFAGIGAGFNTNNGSNEYYSNGSNYGHAITENGLAANFGFNIGLLGK